VKVETGAEMEIFNVWLKWLASIVKVPLHESIDGVKNVGMSCGLLYFKNKIKIKIIKPNTNIRIKWTEIKTWNSKWY
jgi:hypothetical protein